MQWKPTPYEHTYVRSNVAQVDLMYPRNEDTKVDTVQVGLVDVRAADDIQINYDFERDGWVIKQARKFSWTDGDPDAGNPHWTEVAFIQAWALEEKED